MEALKPRVEKYILPRIIAGKYIKQVALIHCCLLFFYAAQAQLASNKNLQEKLQLPAKQIRLDSLSSLVAKQTDFRFSINSSKIKAATLINVPSQNCSLELLLQQLKKEYGVPFAISGNHIILSDRIVDKEIPPVKKQEPRAVKISLTPVINSRIVATKPVLATQPSTFKTDLSIANRRLRLPPRTRTRPIDIEISSTSNKAGIPFLSLYTHIGISADDVMYSNVFAAIGSPWLYITGSWGTQFPIKGYRYGIGSGINLSDAWLLRIDVTTGKFEKGFDTTGFKNSVKSNLHRASFLMERKIINGISIHGGLLLNWLQTKFYVNGAPAAANRLRPWSGENDSRYINVKPIYTISNNFSPDADHYRQIWIGFQAGVIFHLNF